MAVNNNTIIDSIILQGSNDFAQRVPSPSQKGIRETMNFLFDPMNKRYLNEFYDSLIMRVGLTYVRNKMWDNPLGEFERSSLTYGNTIQEVAMHWIDAHAYSYDSKLLNVYKPKFDEWFFSINREDMYPISMQRDELRRVVENEYGLNDLVAAIMAGPRNAAEYDTYRIMLNLVGQYDDEWGFYQRELSADPRTEEGARDLLTQVRADTGRLRFPSKVYNASPIDVPVFASPDELMLLITPDIEAYMDVNVLSATFHVELADVNTRRVIVDEFPMANSFALLTTKDFFVASKVVNDMETFYDPSNRMQSWYYHLWGIYGVSPFVPAILYTYGRESTTTPTVVVAPAALTLTAAETTVAAGGTTQLTTDLTGTVTPETDGIEVKPDSAMFEITLKSGTTKLNGATYVSDDNILHIQKTAVSGDVLTVTATSTYTDPSADSDTTYTASVDITIA